MEGIRYFHLQQARVQSAAKELYAPNNNTKVDSVWTYLNAHYTIADTPIYLAELINGRTQASLSTNQVTVEKRFFASQDSVWIYSVAGGSPSTHADSTYLLTSQGDVFAPVWKAAASSGISQVYATAPASVTGTDTVHVNLIATSPILIGSGPAFDTIKFAGLTFVDSSRAAYKADTAKFCYRSDTSKVTHFADTSKYAYRADTALHVPAASLPAGDSTKFLSKNYLGGNFTDTIYHNGNTSPNASNPPPSLVFANTTAATSTLGTTLQLPGPLQFVAHSWCTTATAHDSETDARILFTPVTGATAGGHLDVFIGTPERGWGGYQTASTYNYPVLSFYGQGGNADNGQGSWADLASAGSTFSSSALYNAVIVGGGAGGTTVVGANSITATGNAFGIYSSILSSVTTPSGNYKTGAGGVIFGAGNVYAGYGGGIFGGGYGSDAAAQGDNYNSAYESAIICGLKDTINTSSSFAWEVALGGTGLKTTTSYQVALGKWNGLDASAYLLIGHGTGGAPNRSNAFAFYPNDIENIYNSTAQPGELCFVDSATGHQIAITASAPSANRSYNLPEAGANGTFLIGSTTATSATTGTMTVNMYSSIITITPTGACTFNANGGATGQLCTFFITTSGTSSFTLTWNTNYHPSATLATGTTSGKHFLVLFECVDGTNWYEVSRTAAL